MVRLKVPYNLVSGVNSVRFQFQYGAIKSGTRYTEFNASMLFQFQYGAIKSHQLKEEIQFYYHVSIPIWCD